MVDQPIRIIGGGFSGLTQAYYLSEAGFKVRLYEKQDHLGGLLGTHIKRGFLFEQAANAFIANKEIERLAEAIGVPLLETKTQAKKRYIFSKGKMRRWPLSFAESFSLVKFMMRGGFRGANNQPRPGETLKQWGERCLSAAVTEQLLEPAMQGVFSISSDQLSAEMVLNSLLTRVEKGHLKGSVSPRSGMSEWVQGMRHFLENQGVEFFLDNQILDLNDGQPTVLAVGLKDLKDLKQQRRLVLPESLQATQLASLTAAAIAFDKEESLVPEGFGCLFARSEGFQALGVLFTHHIFEGRAQAGRVERWIYNDQKQPVSQMSQSQLLDCVLRDRKKLTGENRLPDEMKLSQWTQRIPVYNDDLKVFINDLNQDKRFLYTGNYLGQLGLSKIVLRGQDNLEKIRGGFFG